MEQKSFQRKLTAILNANVLNRRRMQDKEAARIQSNRKLPDILRAKEMMLGLHCLVLVASILAVAIPNSAIANGIGICQRNSHEIDSRSDIFIKETRCNDLNAVVCSPDTQDALIACDGARDAVAFLESNGLHVHSEILIEIVPSLPDVVEGNSAAGCYLESERRVLILAYSEFKKYKSWFRIPIGRSLYRSVVAHEVAHFVVDSNFTVAEPSIQAKEYLAYVTQFSTMEPVLRGRVLSHFPGKAFQGDWQMSTTIYMFDCMSFGVRAYRHFLNLTEGDEYLHAILNGEALTE